MVQLRVIDKQTRILEAAYSLAKEQGYENITRDGVAEEAEVAVGTVNYHFQTIDLLRDQVVKLAVDRRDVDILKSALVNKHYVALRMPATLKAIVARAITR